LLSVTAHKAASSQATGYREPKLMLLATRYIKKPYMRSSSKTPSALSKDWNSFS